MNKVCMRMLFMTPNVQVFLRTVVVSLTEAVKDLPPEGEAVVFLYSQRLLRYQNENFES